MLTMKQSTFTESVSDREISRPVPTPRVASRHRRRRTQRRLMLVGCALVLICSYVIVSRTSRAPNTITGEVIATSLLHFNASLQKDGAVMTVKACDAQGDCAFVDAPRAPNFGWNMLSLVGQYQRNHDPADLQRLKAEFQKLRAASNGLSEMWSLHQVYAAYQLTHDSDYVLYLWDRSNYLLDLVLNRSRVNYYSDYAEAMYKATFAKQLAQTAELLRDPTVVQMLAERLSGAVSAKEISERRAALIREGERQLKLAEGDSQQFRSVRLVTGFERTSEHSCWLEWARLGLYRATGDARYLSEVEQFFSQLHFSSRSASDIHVVTLQQILPCVDALRELASVKLLYQQDLDSLVEKVILPNWDAPQRPLCDGDGGLLGVVSPTGVGGRCVNSIKSSADTGWVISLLSADRRLHELS